MKKEYCSNCGIQLEVGASFCQNCGSKIPSMEEDKQDPSIQKIKDNRYDTESMNPGLSLQNNQQIIVKRSLVAAVFFAILTILPFMEWSPVAKIWAMTFISFFLFICSLIIAKMWHSRSKKLQTLISGKNLLAEWTLSPEQKEKYINYFYEQKKEKNKAIFSLIVFFFVIIFGAFIIFMDEGKMFMFSVAVGLILILSLFAFGTPGYYRNSNRKGDGRVLIGAKYAYINGYFHNWDFFLSGLSRIKIIKKPFYGINLVYYYTDRTLEHSEELFIPASEDVDLKELLNSMKELNKREKK